MEGFFAESHCEFVRRRGWNAGFRLLLAPPQAGRVDSIKKDTGEQKKEGYVDSQSRTPEGLLKDTSFLLETDRDIPC